MIRHLVKRLIHCFLALLGLSVISFVLLRAVPGDTVTAMLGMHYDQQTAAGLRQKYGLDQPLVVQYVRWVSGLVRGDWGTSIRGRPVIDEYLTAIPVTLHLATMALIFAVVTGVPLGTIAAVRHGRPTDTAISFVSLIGLSMPGFWLGTLMILLLSLKLGWLPSGRFVSLMDDPVNSIRHMLMPSIALGLAVMAVLARVTRSTMLDVMNADHVRTAKAKGLAPRRVVVRHVARNGMIPLLTITGLQVGYLLGGSIVIEEVFSLGGVGALTLRALGDRDYAVLQAAILLIGGVFLITNFIVDVLYTWADPRISLIES